MYDGILLLQILEQAIIMSFIDDVAVVLVAKYFDDIANIRQNVIDRLRSWLASVCPKLAEQKKGPNSCKNPKEEEGSIQKGRPQH